MSEAKPAEGKKKDTSNYLFLAVSIVIAVVLWLYVVDSTNPTVTRSYSEVPVEILNQEELSSHDLALLEQSTEMVNVRISGKRKTVLGMRDPQLVATIDLSNCTEGDNYVDIDVHAPNAVDLVSVVPSQILVKVEPVVTEDRPVAVGFTEAASGKKEAVCQTQELETVSITGAKSKVEEVAEVRATIDTSALEESARELTLTLHPVNEDGDAVEDVTLSQETMLVTAQLCSVVSLPVTADVTGSLPEGLQLVEVKLPEQVKLAAPSEQLTDVESLRAEAIDLTQIAEAGETKVELTLRLPENVHLASDQKAPEATVVTVKAKDAEAADEDAAAVEEELIRAGL